MRRNCIGLDIGSSSVKVVVARLGRSGREVTAFDVEPLPPQTIVDGTIMNQSVVVDAIRALWRRQRIKGKGVAIAIAGSSVIVKKITVASMTDAELAEQIPWEAEQHIPFAKDDVEIDYHVILPHTVSGHMELLLVAAKKEIVHDYAAVAREASLVPQIIDVAAFAAQNAFETNYDVPVGEAVALVHVGASLSHINVVKDSLSLFSRDVAVGGGVFTEEIQKRLNVSYDDAEALKAGGREDTVPGDLDRVLAAVAEAVASELTRSLDFFQATNADAEVARIYLSGGSAKLPVLQQVLGQRSRLPIELTDPWRRVEIGPSVDPDFLQAHASEALVGLGLALRAPGDR